MILDIKFPSLDSVQSPLSHTSSFYLKGRPRKRFLYLLAPWCGSWVWANSVPDWCISQFTTSSLPIQGSLSALYSQNLRAYSAKSSWSPPQKNLVKSTIRRASYNDPEKGSSLTFAITQIQVHFSLRLLDCSMAGWECRVGGWYTPLACHSQGAPRISFWGICASAWGVTMFN